MVRITKKHAGGRLVGYARVSTEEQGTDAQIDELAPSAVRQSTRSTPPARIEDVLSLPSFCLTSSQATLWWLYVLTG